MMFRRASSSFIRSLGVLPLSLTVLLALTFALPQHLLNLVCRSGAVMDAETCCPAARAASSPVVGGQAVLRNEACCSWRAVDLDRALSERGPEAAPLGHYAETVVVWRPSLPPPVPVLHPGRSAWPPSSGPPLLLVKSSFLL